MYYQIYILFILHLTFYSVCSTDVSKKSNLKDFHFFFVFKKKSNFFVTRLKQYLTTFSKSYDFFPSFSSFSIKKSNFFVTRWVWTWVHVTEAVFNIFMVNKLKKTRKRWKKVVDQKKWKNQKYCSNTSRNLLWKKLKRTRTKNLQLDLLIL